ncbi:GlsB/YeaQ/YmgE family stress response membrane protein [Albimonas sp. CAU 1670]|uniref:GlsB/YeaQ/YmgE family stress response membrane protein n=1 Tax=Albimonas sp. CAU 1670 TaxID=3032599 RepID=UPI0023DA36F9|nr:GlsB/YeaQ/YmgE family stress response membrane protein [Albimonas sp. CAU 1670]MDF2234275.1 GlsB/YeaQ/YmgE family stress response membrane protein [Albimonas sp. CAU 1670]
MGDIGWFAFLIVGIAAGWIAEKVLKRNHGLLTNLLVGVVGAYLGAYLFGVLGVDLGNDFFGALATATAGAVALLVIINLVRRA